MTTIRDIARELKLSPSTVSRALNKDEKISKETRDRIEYTANAMHYRPRSRRSGKKSSNLIGVICPEIISYNYASVVESVSRSLKKKGYTCVVMITDFDQRLEKEALKNLAEMQVAGIVMIMYDDANSFECMENFRKKHSIPIVQVANFDEYADYDSLMVNNRLAAELAVDHLYELGHRDIAIVTDSIAVERTKMLLNRLEHYGLTLSRDRKIIVPRLRFEEAGYEGAMQLLNMPSHPTAIIASYDYLAIGVLKACSDLGVQVPEEISVVGIDSINTSRYTSKALTTVSMPHTDMGKIAASIMSDRVSSSKEDRIAIQHVSLNPVLMIRDTTAPISRE